MMFHMKALLPLLLIAASIGGRGVKAADDEEDQLLSDECIAENEALDVALANATAAFEDATSHFIDHEDAVELLRNRSSWPNPLPDECFIKNYDKVETIVCLFDYTNYSSSYEQACMTEGGQVFKDEFKFVCQSLSDFRSELTYVNYTACVGISCNPDNVADFFEEEWGNVEGDIESEVGYNCLLLHENFQTDGASSIINLGLLSGVAFLLSSLLMI